MTHQCSFETVTSQQIRHFLRALLRATASNHSHNGVHYYKSDWRSWILFAIFVEKSLLWNLLACWQHEKCVGVHFGDRVKCMWVCLSHRAWSAYVHRLTAVPTFPAPDLKKKNKKKAVYFWMSDFRPRSSMNAAAWKLQGEGCRMLGWTVTFRVVFLVECGSECVQTVSAYDGKHISRR